MRSVAVLLTKVSDYGMDPAGGWSETDSQQFIEDGHIVTPARDEIAHTILRLLPAERDEPFLAVELGVGTGWLSEAVLERFPNARILGLDRSPTMLRQTERTLQRFAGRVELRPFRLEDPSWLQGLEGGVRCFLSCLVIHHLDGPGKERLYVDLFQRLEPGGGLLIADLVAPTSERERSYLAQAWEDEVRRQSLVFSGSLDAYERFLADRANCYRYPDPMDMPSAIPDHLRWLEAADFTGANVFWERGGHAIYGGYKSGME